MKSCIRVLVIALLVFFWFPGANSAQSPSRPPSSDSLLTIPVEVTTVDGIVIQPGDYRVGGGTGLLLCGRPPASLGFWPKPPVRLTPVTASGESRSSVFYYSLNVAVEVHVVYDIPGWSAQGKRATSRDAGWAPYIRHGRLIGLVHDGEMLRVTGAQRIGRPASRR